MRSRRDSFGYRDWNGLVLSRKHRGYLDYQLGGIGSSGHCRQNIKKEEWEKGGNMEDTVAGADGKCDG